MARWAGLVLFLAARCASAQIFAPTPDWQSADQQVSTGAALADLNRDGWLDLIVSNGNDIAQQHVVVYYNNGSGTLQQAPAWQSSDIAYHGHLDVADVNGDGWPDVAVSVLVNQGGPSAKLYLNNGGTLSAAPVWYASIAARSFGVAFGDMDGDGRPDLAVASGWPYSGGLPQVNAVYLNAGGTLSAAPSWQTPEARNFGSAHWLDADRDGRLDLCYTGWNTYTFAYRNLGTTLELQPSYRTDDQSHQFALMSTSGDVTGDGLRDLLIADNNQVFAASGTFRQYPGIGAGFFAPSASWVFAAPSASAVTLGDVDHDGRLDLCAGEWFGRARCFLNTGAGFASTASWTSQGLTTTIEKLVLGDINRDAVQTDVIGVPPGRRLLYLPHVPIERIEQIVVDGVPLTPAQYTFSREHGWLSIGVDAASGTSIRYSWSRSLDLAVANWDEDRPNQVYLNHLPPPCYADCDLSGALNVNDFVCFQIQFAAGSPQADCNHDTLLNVNDFICFQAAFAAGCP